MTAGLSPVAMVTAQYEAMRAWVLAGRGRALSPTGIVVILRQGVAAWLATRSHEQVAPASSPALRAPPTQTLRSAEDGALIALLATMIAHLQHTEEEE